MSPSFLLVVHVLTFVYVFVMVALSYRELLLLQIEQIKKWNPCLRAVEFLRKNEMERHRSLQYTEILIMVIGLSGVQFGL